MGGGGVLHQRVLNMPNQLFTVKNLQTGGER